MDIFLAFLIACAALCLGFGLGMFTAGAVAREAGVGRRSLFGRRKNDQKTVSTITVKVEADTSQATAALDQLQAQILARQAELGKLNRLAFLSAIGSAA